MTNAEKYLKDGISVEEFIDAYLNFSFSRVWKGDENSFDNITKKFFEQSAKPKLTEDERVILRNMDKRYKYIGRTDYEARIQYLFVNIEDGWKPHIMEEFDHLFKFIKERRRI